MRSSKSRSRSKSNRPRSVGNIINRVFDSSGPEGKVRGTPQQIIDKYLQLARDAQLSNDRVAAENFLQHAEHYTRMLGEAQRELAAEQEARRPQGQGQGQGQGQNGHHGGGGQERFQQQPRRDEGERRASEAMAPETLSGTADVIDLDEDANGGGSGLVETPESRPGTRRESRITYPPRVGGIRRDEEPAPAAEAEAEPAPKPDAEAAPEAASAPAAKPRAPRRKAATKPEAEAADPPAGDDKPARAPRPRAPRKPRAAPDAGPDKGAAKTASDAPAAE